MKKVILVMLLLLTMPIVSNDVFANDCTLHEKYLNIAYKKIEQMGLNKTIINVEQLSGSEKNTYLVFELEETGYMIYYKEAGIFIEISTTVPSPYKNLHGEFYYFGPGQYQMNIDYLGDQVETEKSMRMTIHENMARQKDVESNDETEIIAQSLLFGDVEISEASYFENVQENMPINYNSACGYVALAVYLGYFDQIYNNGVVPNWYENDFDPTEPIGTNQDFYEYLITLDGKDLNDPNEDFATTAYDIKNLAREYLVNNPYVDDSDFFINWSYLPLNYTIRNAIDNNVPSILFVKAQFPVWVEKANHAIIAYGYNDDMFIVNCCLQGNNGYSRFYLSEYIIGSYMKMRYSPSSC